MKVNSNFKGIDYKTGKRVYGDKVTIYSPPQNITSKTMIWEFQKVFQTGILCENATSTLEFYIDGVRVQPQSICQEYSENVRPRTILQDIPREVIYPAIYKHFKEKYYATMGIVTPVPRETLQKHVHTPNAQVLLATHTETKLDLLVVFSQGTWYINEEYTTEQLVLYKSLYDEGTYIRPKSMFLSHVDHDKYPTITQQYRFELFQHEGEN